MSTERDAVAEDGFLANAFELAEEGVLPSLVTDAPVFDAALEDYARRGQKRVPYILTEAITEVAFDRNLVAVVESVLDTDCWVMWGSNIRRSVPNESQRWHVDLESVLWPSLTVAIGLEGCSEQSGTWFIPGTNRIGKGPRTWVRDCSQTSEVVAKAKSIDERCGEAKQVSGFRNGGFYVFDAKCWHKADAVDSANKLVLYLHYQRGDAKRVPHMLDYEIREWSLEATPYIGSPGSGSIERSVYRPPLRQLLSSRLQRMRNGFR